MQTSIGRFASQELMEFEMDEKSKIIELYGCKNVYGPYEGKDGRKRCVLYFEKGNTTSKSYPRLIAEAKLGRILTDNEEVDHRDTDHTNDSTDNLQVLSVDEHREKSAIENYMMQSNKELVICPNCGCAFSVTQTRLRVTDTPCCSRSCSSQYNGVNQYSNFGKKFKT